MLKLVRAATLRDTSRTLLALTAATAAVAVAAPAASASDFTYVWNQGGNGLWSNAANWAGGVAPSGTVDTLTFPERTSGQTFVDPSDDLSGLTVSRIVTHSYQTLGGSAGTPLTLGSGITTDPLFKNRLLMPLVLSGPNTWNGSVSAEGGVSGAQPLDVTLAVDQVYGAMGDGVKFLGASNEVGPISVTGTDWGMNTVTVSSDLNGANGNPIILKAVRLTPGVSTPTGPGVPATGFDATLGAISSISKAGITIGASASSTHRKVQVASATLDPTSALNFTISPSQGSTPGVDYGQLLSSGPINLNGAYVTPAFTETTCPAVGLTYTLISTTGTLSGSAANDLAPIQCGNPGSPGPALSFRLDYNRTGSPQTVTGTVVPTPRPVSPPVVSGTTTVGQQLTATHGTWDPAAASYSDQWYRCSSATACRSIAGATGLTYTLTAADVGQRIRVIEAVPGGAPQASELTAVVAAAPASGTTDQTLPTAAEVKTALQAIGAPPSNASVGSVLAKGATLTFDAPSAGALSVNWYQVPAGAKVAAKKRPILVARGTKTVTKAGTVKVLVKLTAAGKRLLKATKKAKRSLKLTSKVVFTPKGGKATNRISQFKLKR